MSVINREAPWIFMIAWYRLETVQMYMTMIWIYSEKSWVKIDLLRLMNSSLEIYFYSGDFSVEPARREYSMACYRLLCMLFEWSGGVFGRRLSAVYSVNSTAAYLMLCVLRIPIKMSSTYAHRRSKEYQPVVIPLSTFRTIIYTLINY